MAQKAEAFELFNNVFGSKRLRPITVMQAEELVKKGESKKLRQGLYQRTKRGPNPGEQTRKLETPKPKRK